MLPKLILLVFSISILLSTTGCTVVRFAENSVGYGVKQIDTIDTQSRNNQLSRQEFGLNFNVTQRGFSVQLQYEPYYRSETREIVRTRARITALDLAVGLVSACTFGWTVYDNWTGSGVYIPNANGDLRENASLNWGETALWEKAVLIGVPIDFLLSGFLHTATQEFTKPWEMTEERAGALEIVQNHPYRIELLGYNFSKDYRTVRDAKSIPIGEFLEDLPTPRRLLNSRTLEFRAFAKDYEGNSHEQIFILRDEKSLEPFHKWAENQTSGIAPPRIHALLILMESDLNIRQSVKQNGSQMKELLSRSSDHTKVHLTVMTTTDPVTGSVTTMELSDGERSNDNKTPEEGPIREADVSKWIENLPSRKDDTILIYYNGHGVMQQDINNDRKDRHILTFEPRTGGGNKVSRSTLSTLLEKKPGRLKMLITDTCSNRVDPPELLAKTYSTSVRPRIMPSSYIKNLFLEHDGILDITAAQPGQYAGSSTDIGGWFTFGLIQSITDESDTDKDGFLTWEEVFKTSQQKTDELFKEKKEKGTEFGDNKLKNQKTQKPFNYGPLPEPDK